MKKSTTLTFYYKDNEKAQTFSTKKEAIATMTNWNWLPNEFDPGKDSGYYRAVDDDTGKVVAEAWINQ